MMITPNSKRIRSKSIFKIVIILKYRTAIAIGNITVNHINIKANSRQQRRQTIQHKTTRFWLFLIGSNCDVKEDQYSQDNLMNFLTRGKHFFPT